MNNCINKNCEKKIKAKNLCAMHYARATGQVKKEINSPPKKEEKHGMTKTKEYRIWTSMKNRCYSKNNKYYHRYGGRGIIVCDEWKNSFLTFLKDMGKRPFFNAQIDRINNNGNYEPNNCRWATPLENSRNSSTIKLDEDKVKIILFYDSVSTTFLSNLYKVHKETIRFIRKRKNS